MIKIGGIDKLTLDGTEYAVKEGVEVSLSTHTKEVKVDQTGNVVGYKEVDYRAAYIKGTLILNENTPTDFLVGKNSISCELVYKGKTFIGSDGVDVGEGLLNTEEGEMEFEIRFTSLVEA